MTDEEKAEEYVMREDVDTMKYSECYNERVFFEKEVKQAYLGGLAAGREEIKKQWHDCFLSCSSPYCAGHFRAVKMQGELGNMAKGE